jgi:serine/threonine-protein kinase
MSPEQATAAAQLDGRSDVYSLGCVLYEMLAGHPPFLGSTAQEILARHTLDPVPPLRTIRPELPHVLEHTVRKALAKSPADRWRSPAAFSEALARAVAPPSVRKRAVRSIGLVAVGAILLAAGYALFSRRPVAGSSGEAAHSIAVLPFVNIGADPANEPFSDGMSEELITALAKVAELRVTARTSAFSFKGKAVDVREIGSKLNVSYVLEGSVRRAGPHLRVSAQLINAATGYHLWSDEYDRDARDVFTVQDEIARAIVGALRVKLSGAANAALVKPATENPEAHDLYLQGRYFFAKRDSTSLRKAQDYFERAIAKDPSYALAYAGLSDAYSHRAVFGYVPPHGIHSQAKEAALRALALDSTLVEAHTSLGFIELFLEWDWPTAGREFNRALALDPRYPPAHLFRGWYFLATDRMTDAVGEVQTAVRLDPFSLVNNARLATMLYYARRSDEALAQARRLLELDSMFFQVRVELARVYQQLGRCDEALATIKQAPEQAAAPFNGVAGWIAARCQHPAQAVAELNRFRAEAREGRYASHYSLAMIYAGLGDTKRAFAHLDSAYVNRTWAMFTLRVEPAFDPLRADPRFGRLLKKVGLVS